MTPLNLSTASESQVNAMVAEKVAGITVTEWDRAHERKYQSGAIPNYIHNLDALLPLLNNHDWLLANERGCWFCEINFPESRIIKFGSTLNLAIITALLRAAGVEVV